MYHSAAPPQNIIVVSVTMNGGILKRLVHTPLNSPITPPTARNAASAPGTANGVPSKKPPSAVMTDAPTTLASAITDGADRSMPATISTNVWPMETTSSGIIAARMSSSVSAVTSSGTNGSSART